MIYYIILSFFEILQNISKYKALRSYINLYKAWNIIPKYLYTFSEFVEHALRLQAQSERRLSIKCINILEMYLKRQLLIFLI